MNNNILDNFNIKAMERNINQNPKLIEAAVELHQSGKIPPNCYVLDYDVHLHNAKVMVKEAEKYGISLYYMSKQTGRNPFICKAAVNAGFKGIVCVESQEAKSIHRYGLPITHVGHLNQTPKNDIYYVLSSIKPEVITVFSVEMAKLISDVAKKLGITQELLVRPIGKNDTLYSTMNGGFYEENIVESVKEINDLPGVKVVGVTSFPCMAYYMGSNTIELTPNFHTIVESAEKLERELGIDIKQINIPANCTSATMKKIAENGGTHAEPGIGVSGMGVTQIFGDEPEIPGCIYVSEVSHIFEGQAYAYGGGFSYISGYGFYPDGTAWITGANDLPLNALVGDSAHNIFKNLLPVDPPGKDSLNYTVRINLKKGNKIKIGDTVVFGFPTQIFATRSYSAIVKGISENKPELLGIFDQGNNLVNYDGRLLGENAVIEMLSRL